MIKNSARIFGMRPEMVLAYVIADRIYQRHGADAVITSLIDDKHSKGSFHYNGLGMDLRTKNLNSSQVHIVHEKLKHALGPDFDVILESHHIHVEFQPKEPYTVPPV